MVLARDLREYLLNVSSSVMSKVGLDKEGHGTMGELGELKGYKTHLDEDPFENHVGQFYANFESKRTAFRVKRIHCNNSGILHGGALMS